jgi:hypothetical protein
LPKRTTLRWPSPSVKSTRFVPFASRETLAIAQPAIGIARWDGVSWEPVGGGTGGGNHTVRALTSHNGELIAGGYFTSAGGQPMQCIAVERHVLAAAPVCNLRQQHRPCPHGL